VSTTTHTANCTVIASNLNSVSNTDASLNLSLQVQTNSGNTGIFSNAVGTVLNVNIPNVTQPVPVMVGQPMVITITQ